MLQRAFSEAFRRLLGRFHEYQDAPRDPEALPELAKARFALEDARGDAARARDTHQIDPPTPDFVEPGLGTDSRSTTGKIAAGLFAVIAIAGTVLALQVLRSTNERPIEVVDGTWTEAIVVNDGGACLWLIEAELLNTTDNLIVMGRTTADTNFGRVASTSDPIQLEPGSTTSVALPMVFTPPSCPDTIADLVAEGIRVNAQVVGPGSASRNQQFSIDR